MQFLADILDITIERPQVTETTSLGAAMLAGLGAGLYDSLEGISVQCHLDRNFNSKITATERDNLLSGW